MVLDYLDDLQANFTLFYEIRYSAQSCWDIKGMQNPPPPKKKELLKLLITRIMISISRLARGKLRKNICGLSVSATVLLFTWFTG